MKRILCIYAVFIATVFCTQAVASPQKVAVIFSKSTGRIRSIFQPEKELELNRIKLIPGEDYLILYLDEATIDINVLQQKVSSLTGTIPKNDRYAIVDNNGNIVGSLIADPTCGDKILNCTLIQSDNADKGWSWTQGGGFISPQEKPPYTDTQHTVLQKYHDRDRNTVFSLDEKDTLSNLGIQST